MVISTIRKWYTIMLLLAIILSVGVIGAFGVYTIWGKTNRDLVTIMNLTTESKAVGIDYALLKIKDPVETVAAYVGARVATTDKSLDLTTIQNSLKDEILELCQSSYHGINGIVGYYIFFLDPYDSILKSFGFQKGMNEKEFHEVRNTLSQSDPNDADKTLYWINVTAGKKESVWTAMRKSHYRDGYIFSYIVPIFFNDELVGVAGVDVDFYVLAKPVREVSLFGGGYAYLTDDKGKVYYHPLIGYGILLTEDEEDVPEVDSVLGDTSSHGKLITYKYKGQVKKMAFKSLINGMRLVVTANEEDVLRETTSLIQRTIIAAVVIMLFFISLALMLEKRTMHPALDKLDSLAHLDGLTGVWNRTSFLEVQRHINQMIHDGNSSFGFVMFDVNNLKEINDRYGHEKGDTYLLNAVEMIEASFPGNQIYRLGGDEFVVVLEQEDSLRTAADRLEFSYALQQRCRAEKKEPWETPSIAGSFVAFNPQVHRNAEDVFEEADELMYQEKDRMKNNA